MSRKFTNKPRFFFKWYICKILQDYRCFMKCVLHPTEVELTLLTAANIVLCFIFVAKMLPTSQCFDQCWAVPTLLQGFLAKAAQYPLPASPLKAVCHSCVLAFHTFGELYSLEDIARHSSHTISLRGWLWWFFHTYFHNLFLWTNFIPCTGHFIASPAPDCQTRY